MKNSLIDRAEASSIETFPCGTCGKNFEAKIITWVDVSRTPQAKRSLLRWDFNTIQCTHCGCRTFSGTPFFYEDFEEGLLVAVFPRIPDRRGDVERDIRARFGYYPVLEFFYDMTQIWLLIYFQERFAMNGNPRVPARSDGEERLRRMLLFLKEDPLMLDIREKLTESFFNHAASDDLADILELAEYVLEDLIPWPLDRRCICGGDLAAGLACCGHRINLDSHDHLLSRRYSVYCPTCKKAFSGASCGTCGRAYTWKLGIVDS